MIKFSRILDSISCENCENWNTDDFAGHKDLGDFVCACSELSDIENGMTRYTKPDDFCGYFEKKERKNGNCKR